MRWLGILEAPKVRPIDQRGYLVAYRTDSVNHCPGCGRSQWYVGLSTAECAFCETAIPLAAPSGMRRPVKERA